MRNDTGAQIRILKSEHLPLCAMTNDELLQINGEASIVKKALHQVASRLHDNRSRSQHLLNPSMRNMYQQGRPNASAHKYIHHVIECIELGVRKFNVNTEVRNAYLESLRSVQQDLVHIIASAKEAMKAVVAEKMHLFGSAEKA